MDLISAIRTTICVAWDKSFHNFSDESDYEIFTQANVKLRVLEEGDLKLKFVAIDLTVKALFAPDIAH